MKEIVLTPRFFRREALFLLGCFVFGVLFDLFAIVKYGRPFVELFQTIGYELVITLAAYLALAVFRLLIFAIRRLFKR